jgi:outer membrane protein assembly factor BamB
MAPRRRNRCLLSILTALSLVAVLGPANATDPDIRPTWAIRSHEALFRLGTPTVLASPEGRSAIVVGAVWVGGRPRLLVRALAAAGGTTRWSTTLGGPRRPYHQAGWATLDDAGNVYVLASFRRSSGRDGVLVASLDPNGARRWLERIGGAADLEIGDVVLSPDDSRLYVGMTTGPAPKHVVLTAFDTLDGSRLWSGRYDGRDERPDLMEEGDGSLIATATTILAAVCGRCDRQRNDVGWATTVAVDAATGTLSWDGVTGGPGWQAAYAEHRLAVTPDGRTVVAGGWARTRPAAIAFDLATGATLWRRTFPGQGALQAAAVEPGGTTALLAGNAPYDQLAVVALDVATGELLWRNRLRSWVGAPWIIDVALGPRGGRFFIAAAICGGSSFVEGLPCAIDFGLLRYRVGTGRRTLVGRYGPPHMNVAPSDLAVGAVGRVFETGTWNATEWPPVRIATAMFGTTAVGGSSRRG